MRQIPWKLWLVLALTLTTGGVGLTGCDNSAEVAAAPGTGAVAANAPTAGVALLDLDEIANGLGRREQLTQELTLLRQGLDQELENRRAELQAELMRRQEALGETPTDEQRGALVQSAQNAQADLQRRGMEAQQRVAQRQQVLATNFRDEIRPIAMTIAKSKGFGVVMLKTDLLLGYEPEHDITQAVLQKAQEIGMGAAQKAGADRDVDDTPVPAMP